MQKSPHINLEEQVDEYLNLNRAEGELNAFLEIFSEDAILRAKEVQQRIDAGKAGKLHGMVIGLKDNICYQDHISSAASRSLEGFSSVYNATAVEKLLSADAIILGRTNCDEFAMGGTNETSAYGRTLNPLDRKKVPGGSSGGSAAAVAAGLCQAAIGSDTGGSIRQPASFCGLVGLKPSYGRISRYGLIAYGSSLDQIGPITRNVEDAALLLETMAGFDENDSTSSGEEVPEYSKMLEKDSGPCRIAYLEEPLAHKGLDPEIRERTLRLIEQLKSAGHIVEPVKFPYLDFLVPAYYVIATAEASSNLARYDGIHYGHRSKNATDIRSTIIKSRSEGFGTEVKRRIMTGTFVLSAGFYDAYYGKAQRVRRMIYDRAASILSGYSFILLPTTPRTAFNAGTMGEDPVALYLEDIFTILANLSGIPAISLPLGQHSNGMPFGIQLMAGHFQEGPLLNLSRQIMDKFDK